MNDLRVHHGPVRVAVRDLERLTFELEPVPPFRLDLTVWALRRRAANAVDRWDGATWRRVLVVGGHAQGIEVVQTAPPERPMLRVAVTGRAPCARSAVRASLVRVLGLDRDLSDFYRAAADDPDLGRLAERFKGLKPPRFPTLFETLLNAFACQQVTLSLGIQLLNRLAKAYGPGLDGPDGRDFAFPSPDDLAACAPDQLRGLGFSRQKAQAIIELARAVAEGGLDLDALEQVDDATAVARLQDLRGVGRWTAEYALLRGLGRLHVFPGDDVGARNNLQRWLGFLEPLDYEGVRRALARRAPFQGLVYLHLLLNSLQLERHGVPEEQPMTIDLERAYDPPAKNDSYRVLVDRIWPRGVAKDDLKIDVWLKDVAPSTGLRRWFGHDPKKWDEFKRRYARELEPHAETIDQLAERAKKGHVTLIFGAKDTLHNNAAALKEHLERRLKR